MSLLINDNLIWIAIPRCGSLSIKQSLLNSDLNVKTYLSKKIKRHYHVTINDLYEKFGVKETVCIKRDWISKWISGLNHFFNYDKVKSKYTWQELNNEIIYEIFSNDLINKVVYQHYDNIESFKSPYFEQTQPTTDNISIYYMLHSVLVSQNYWKNNKKCTYEFDIKEIDKFKSFIENRFDVKINLPHEHKSVNEKNGIVIDDKLKNWIWNNFEKPFLKTSNLI